MKTFLLFIICISFFTTAFSQAAIWTWMKGDTGLNSSGYFGLQGIADPQNSPPAFSTAATWTDLNGNFWMFGGWNGPSFSDLWKFDPLTENWTWVKGPGIASQPAVFGIQGIPSPDNNPPPILSNPLTWIDAAGNLWLYGGFTPCGLPYNGELAALWKYEIFSNEWTWMNGSDQCNIAPVHGALNIPDPSNTPGSRYETTACWRSADSLFLFGGRNQNYPVSKYYDDIWKYDLSTNEWTWIKGSNIANQPASYGTMGISDPSNTPGSRAVATCWVDLYGDFLLWGANYKLINDLWKYDRTTNNWTWLGGVTTPLDTGNYVTECSSDTTQRSAAKLENNALWRTATGLLFNFGGSPHVTNFQNDLWTYCPQDNRWVLIKGSNLLNQQSHYGTQGIADAANIPSARRGSVSFTDALGRFWLWGGYDFNNAWKNDMWIFEADYSCFENVCKASQLLFNASSTSLCEKFCTNFFDQSINNPTSWQWQFTGGNPVTSSIQNPTNICYDIPGTYDVTLITTTANGNDTLTIPDYITVHATPPFPIISQNGYTLTSSAADFYQWQLNTVDIAGATNQSYIVAQSGFYTVVVYDAYSCKNSASVNILITGIEDVINSTIAIYPNPSNGKFTVELLNTQIAEAISLSVKNALGQEIFSWEEKIVSSNYRKEIVLGDAEPGVYSIGIKAKNIFLLKKIMITK